MMLDVITMVLTIGIIFIGLPWLVLYYLARMRGLPLRQDMESRATLNELFQLAERLDERLRVIERIVAAEEKQAANGPLQELPDFRPPEEGEAPPIVAAPHPKERKP